MSGVRVFLFLPSLVTLLSLSSPLIVPSFLSSIQSLMKWRSLDTLDQSLRTR